MATLLKWGIKLGAAGGSIYYAHTENLFGTAPQTIAAYDNLKVFHNTFLWSP